MDQLLIKNVLSQFPGKMITVNNHKIHIYSEGKGTPSLIFLSGSGTSSPMYDFKKMFIKMSDEYQIAVLEKAGYGFSEVTDMSRDIDTILFETRTVLKEANIIPPYILLPHSMSGIEALYWVQCYPNEIKAIIGIDPALPPFYENMNLDSTMKKLKFASKVSNGKLKFLLPMIANFLPPIKYGMLSEVDKDICKALIFHRTLTNDMLNEVLMSRENARKINNETLKTVPMLFFITKGWEKMIRDYTKEFNIEIIPFSVDHYLHDIIPEELSKRSKIFIKNKVMLPAVTAASKGL